jgi:hypothetical protein
MTFREYLERRAIGDAEVEAFLMRSDRETLDQNMWARLMGAFREQGRDVNYILQARKLHFEFGRAETRLMEARWKVTQRGTRIR